MLPSALSSRYEALLLQNLSTVQTVESAIRNVTWLLPGRFEDAELASEALYAVSNIVSSHHDSVLSARLPESPFLPPHPFDPEPEAGSSTATSSSDTSPSPHSQRLTPLLPVQSDHQRYTRFWTQQSGLYRKASRLLRTLQFVELLIEMLARRKGDAVRWRAVLWIESIKTFLRLILLRITKRPVLSPPTPQREYDISLLPQTVLDKASSSRRSPFSEVAPEEAQPGKPAVSTLPPKGALRGHLLPMAGCLPESHLAHPLTLVPELDAKGYVAECLSSTATLVQVILMLRAARRTHGSSSNALSFPSLSRHLQPFLVALLMRLVARHLRTSPGSSSLLASHQATTDTRLAKSFFLKGPVWIRWTRPKVMAVVKALERVPLVGIAGGLIEAYLPLVDDNFYYTSS